MSRSTSAAAVVEPHVHEQRERVEPADSARGPGPVDEHDAAVGPDQDVVGAHVAMHQPVADEVGDRGIGRVGERRKPRGHPLRELGVEREQHGSGRRAAGASPRTDRMSHPRASGPAKSSPTGSRARSASASSTAAISARFPRKMRMPSLDVFEHHVRPSRRGRRSRAVRARGPRRAGIAAIAASRRWISTECAFSSRVRGLDEGATAACGDDTVRGARRESAGLTRRRRRPASRGPRRPRLGAAAGTSAHGIRSAPRVDHPSSDQPTGAAVSRRSAREYTFIDAPAEEPDERQPGRLGELDRERRRRRHGREHRDAGHHGLLHELEARAARHLQHGAAKGQAIVERGPARPPCRRRCGVRRLRARREARRSRRRTAPRRAARRSCRTRTGARGARRGSRRASPHRGSCRPRRRRTPTPSRPPRSTPCRRARTSSSCRSCGRGRGRAARRPARA